MLRTYEFKLLGQTNLLHTCENVDRQPYHVWQQDNIDTLLWQLILTTSALPAYVSVVNLMFTVKNFVSKSHVHTNNPFQYNSYMIGS